MQVLVVYDDAETGQQLLMSMLKGRSDFEQRFGSSCRRALRVVHGSARSPRIFDAGRQHSFFSTWMRYSRVR